MVGRRMIVFPAWVRVLLRGKLVAFCFPLSKVELGFEFLEKRRPSVRLVSLDFAAKFSLADFS